MFPATVVERAESASSDCLQQHYESSDRSQNLSSPRNLARVISRFTSNNRISVLADQNQATETNKALGDLADQNQATETEKALGDTKDQERLDLGGDTSCIPVIIYVCREGDERDDYCCNVSRLPAPVVDLRIESSSYGE